MKIAELCLSPDLGGLELYMLRCCEALRQGGDEILPIIHPDGRLKGYIENLGISSLLLQTRVKSMPLLAASRLARLIDQQQLDAIHIHWGKDLPLAALAKALSRRKPRLVYTRQMMLTRSKDDHYHRFLYRQMDLMLTITRQLEQVAREYLPSCCVRKIETLYHGVAPPATVLGKSEREALRQQWRIDEPDAMVVGLFGRIEPYKGQHLMIDALANEKLQDLPVHLLMVGHVMDRGYDEALRAQVEQLGLGTRVHFYDFIDEPQRWMQGCDVVALTTMEETFGLVLAEAMQCGVAVLGSDAGGVPEIIEHGKTGLLFSPGDSHSLGEQLYRYATDHPLRQNLANAGRQYARTHFDRDEHYRRLRGYLAAK